MTLIKSEKLFIIFMFYLIDMSLQESCRIAIQKEGMIKDLVKNLSSDNDELQMHCVSTIFKVTITHFFGYCYILLLC